MLNATSEASPNIIRWNSVASFAHALDRFLRTRNPDKMQLDRVALRFRFFEHFQIGLAAKG